MKTKLLHLQHLIQLANHEIPKLGELKMSSKPIKEVWSKKEILGHLIDSAIYNYQRFSEIPSSPSPYQVKPYPANELVLNNSYQSQKNSVLLSLWVKLNQQIIHQIELQDENSLQLKIFTSLGKESDFKFLILDYIKHLEHHLSQILEISADLSTHSPIKKT